MSSTLTKKDERYEEMFQVQNEIRTFGMGLIDDPYPAWRRMLATAPVMKGTLSECMGLKPQDSGHMYVPGPVYYTAISFNAVNDAFMDNETYSSAFYTEHGHVAQMLGDTILSMGGTRHRRFRDVIQAHFQPGVAINWWGEKVIKGPVEELISSVEKKGACDLNADFFARLPMHVVTAGFGLSPEEGLDFRHHMQRFNTLSVSAEDKAKSMQAALGILNRVIEARRKEPQDDIISRLTQAKLKLDDGPERPLNQQEILDFCRLIVFAGGGTTWRQLGITTLALLDNPDQLDQLRRDRSLIPNAILESVRWHPTDPLFPRLVTRDTTLQGVALPAGSALHLSLGSANRDPSRWDDPDKFDIHRPMQRSLAFGTGVHSCLGQHVARQEIVMALNAIFDRLPNVRWDDSKPRGQIIGGLMGRGPGPLHVVYG
jgi:cytochrome P450